MAEETLKQEDASVNEEGAPQEEGAQEEPMSREQLFKLLKAKLDSFAIALYDSEAESLDLKSINLDLSAEDDSVKASVIDKADKSLEVAVSGDDVVAAFAEDLD